MARLPISWVVWVALWAAGAACAASGEAGWSSEWSRLVRSRPSVGPASGSVRLRVLSYNIKDFPAGVIDDGGRAEEVGRALARRRELGTAPDVVLLQEAFGSGTERLLRAAGYPHVAAGPAFDEPPPGGGSSYQRMLESGLRALSLHPIVARRGRAFGACAAWDCLANKGVLHVSVRVPGAPSPVELATTHMNANRDRHPVDTQARVHEVRRRQIDALAEFLAVAKGRAAVLAGDFNLRPGDPNYPHLFERLSMSSAGEVCVAGGCELDPRTSAVEALHDAVDHHLFADGARVSVRPRRLTRNFREPVAGRPLSDHLGFEVEYELIWGPPTVASAP